MTSKRQFDSLILGAGAAGLMCALTAGQRGRRVLVLDRSNKIGKKILMSGGGKCNFTNLHTTPERFLSANPHFCKSALARYTQWHFIEMVERHGIDYFEKHTVNGLSGQLFCRDSSKQIVGMLRSECEGAGVTIITGCETSEVRHQDGFTLVTSKGEFSGDSLVVATGALSIPSLGGSGFAYTLAEQFGLKLLPTRAGLVPLTFSDANHALFAELSGVSCEVLVGNARAQFREDLLFTHRGLSGPAVLQISSYWQPGEAISVNLLPGMNAYTALLAHKKAQPRTLLRTALGAGAGMASVVLPKKLVAALEARWWPELAETRLADWPDRALQRVADQLQGWSLTPAGTEGYRTAEVTLGGIDTRGLSSKTMQAATTPGLFFIGEAVDVTGHLGGFNFQWAWASGHAAGVAV